MTFDPRSVPAAADFDPGFRLAWNDRGLLLLVTVKDNLVIESDDVDKMYEKDSVILFVADKLASPNVYNLVISPGVDPNHPKVRTSFCDRRPNPAEWPKLTAEVASRKIDGGYVVEALLPWENLRIKPESGREIALQVYCQDYDGEKTLREPARWFSALGAPDNTKLMHRVRLAYRASAPVLAAASGRYELLRRTKVRVNAVKALAKQLSFCNFLVA